MPTEPLSDAQLAAWEQMCQRTEDAQRLTVSGLGLQCQPLLDALPALLAEVRRLRQERRERDAICTKLVDDANWASDILDRYERRLLQFGDPKELVHSAAHVSRKFAVRQNVEYAWQMLNENSGCHACRAGNVPLDGWHTFLSGDKQPCLREEGSHAR